MTAQQKKELYEILDYDERAAQVEAIEATSDTELFHVTAKLKRGSLALLSNPEENSKELLSVVFDKPEAVVIKRPENFEASVSLMDFGVFDGVTEGTLYKQIVHVKDGNAKAILDKPIEKMEGSREDEPFFSFKFEYKPLDGRADNALSISMRSMEIIYHRGYVEAVYAFFKPPKSQLQSVEALLVSGARKFSVMITEESMYRALLVKLSKGFVAKHAWD
jgi:vacuolar protein sorting-associated protein 13A/C